MRAGREDFELLNHFTILVYPFAHSINVSKKRGLPQCLESAWSPWWLRLKEERLAAAIDSTFFFLPYIRELLFPETSQFAGKPPGQNHANWIAAIKTLNEKGITSINEALPPGVNIRLTYRRDLMPAIVDFRFSQQPPTSDRAQEDEGLPASVDWIDSMFFSSGVGFLMLKVRLGGPATLSQLTSLNHYLRLVHPPTVSWRMPTLRFRSTSASIRDLIDFLLQGLTAGSDSIVTGMSDFLKRMDESPGNRFTDSEFGRSYGERCQLLSYACIDARGGDNIEAGPFPSGTDRLLYEFASCIPLGHSIAEPTWVPARETVGGLAANKISIWQSWSGIAFKESGVFLATEDIPFNRQNFPENIENNYLLLYLYTLHQKYQLFVFSNDLMQKGAHVERNIKEVRGLMERFDAFRNRYWFNEITRRPMGDEIYRKFQAGLGVTSLYDLVCSEVKDMDEYYERRHNNRIGLLVNLFTFVFVPLGAVIGIFGMTFFSGSWRSFVIACVIVAAASFALWRWWTRQA